MKITAANTIRIPVQATDCTILQSVQAACKVAEVKLSGAVIYSYICLHDEGRHKFTFTQYFY